MLKKWVIRAKTGQIFDADYGWYDGRPPMLFDNYEAALSFAIASLTRQDVVATREERTAALVEYVEIVEIVEVSRGRLGNHTPAECLLP